MMTLFNNIGNWYANYYDQTMVWADNVRAWIRANPALAGFGFVLSCAIGVTYIVILMKIIKKSN